MKVALADVREEPLEQAAAQLRDSGGEAIAVRTDVTRLDEVEALAAATLAEFGAVHVLCNNAGVGLFTRIAETTIDDWPWTLEIDLWGPIDGVKTFLPIIEREDEGHDMHRPRWPAYWPCPASVPTTSPSTASWH